MDFPLVTLPKCSEKFLGFGRINSFSVNPDYVNEFWIALHGGKEGYIENRMQKLIKDGNVIINYSKR